MTQQWQGASMTSVIKIINELTLEPHPEGGYFNEIYKSTETVSSRKHPGRSASTMILYLLNGKNYSAWHRIDCDELWTFASGNTHAHIYIINSDGTSETHQIGDIEDGFSPLVTIEGNKWFAVELAEKSDEHYTLFTCSCAPGFEYEYFELATEKQLTDNFPMHAELFARLSISD